MSGTSDPSIQVDSAGDGIKLADFLQVAMPLYGEGDRRLRGYDAPFYYAPLRRALRHPFLGRRSNIVPFIARRDGTPVASAAAIMPTIGPHKTTGYFGFFETINDPAVAAKLLQRIEAHFKARGIHKILGPVCPDMNEFPGILIQGHDSWNSPHTAYNPAYYADVLAACGYAKAKDLLAISATIQDDYDILNIVRKRATTRGVVLSPIRGPGAPFTLNRIWPIYVEAHRKNWQEVPIKRSKFVSEFSMLAALCPPGLFQIASVGDQVVGFGAAIPDTTPLEACVGTTWNPTKFIREMKHLRKPLQVRVPLLCVATDFRNRGIDAALMHGVWSACRAAGVRTGEFSWILADNHKMIGPLKKIGGTANKVWRLFEKNLL